MKFILALLSGLLFSASACAQDAIALSVEGWRQEAGADGVVYYRCASSICAAGSVVSYKRQPHRPRLTMADFQAHHRNLAEQNRGVGRVRAVRLSDARQRVVDGVRVMQIRREVDWTDGTTTFTIEARLIGADKSFSLVSDSSRSEWTTNNFEGFLRQLAIIAGVRGG